MPVFSLFSMEANASIAGKRNDKNESSEECYARACTMLALENNKILLSRDECGGHVKEILMQL